MKMFILGFTVCAGLAVLVSWSRYQETLELARKVYALEHGRYPDC